VELRVRTSRSANPRQDRPYSGTSSWNAREGAKAFEWFVEPALAAAILPRSRFAKFRTRSSTGSIFSSAASAFIADFETERAFDIPGRANACMPLVFTYANTSSLRTFGQPYMSW